MAESSTPAPRATSNRSTTPVSDTFKDYIAADWAERTDAVPGPRDQAPFAAARRARISALYRGKRLIVPAGAAKVRSNDTDYPYRAHSAFAHLTGWGSDSEPDAVLVMEPSGDSHEATLFFRERAGRDSDEFYANPQIGEFWIGARPSLAQVAGDLGLATRGIAELEAVLDSVDADTLIVRDADRDLTDQVDGRRLLAAEADSIDEDSDTVFARDLSELRLVKDEYEIDQMRKAVAATRLGFDDVIADRPAIVAHPKGERLVEGTFNRRARADGNTVGYDTIAASGPHACILHWTRNNGPVNEGDLILLDAGIELDSYYTADITRTLPINGTFTPTQRKVYEAVLEAADAAFAIVRPGIRSGRCTRPPWRSSRRRPRSGGCCRHGGGVDQTDAQYHRRYMVHGHRTTWGSTCTTARRRGGRCTWTVSSRPAWCSRSSRGCTSSPTT